jgi:hypothetical protein
MLKYLNDSKSFIKNFKLMNAIKESVYYVTPSGLNMFALAIHNFYVPSRLIPG